MKSGDMVYYRLSKMNAIWANASLASPLDGRKVNTGEVLPAVVITAYGCLQEGAESNVITNFFSGYADLKVFLPMERNLWVENAEMDESPVPAPQELQVHGSLLVYPAHGKFTTVEPPPLI